MAAAVKNADKVHNMCDIITTNNRNAILNYNQKRKWRILFLKELLEK